MIVVKIYGGLAGQMLQYSLGRHLSIKYKTDLYLDVSWYNEHYNHAYPREFRLDKLRTSFKLLDRSNLLWKIKLTKRFKSINPFAYDELVEQDFSVFDPTVLNAGKNIVLNGYWNSYKYFEPIKSVLIDELCPKEVPDEKNSTFLRKIKETNSISVHFRRGDYKNTSFHGLLTKEYYEQAIRLIASQDINPYLFIFSDEPKWVLENVNFDLPYEVIDFNNNNKNFMDIELMKNCKHNIIANSGFSWWGAFLNKNPNKIIIAPKIWIAEQERSMSDFVDNEWIRI